MMYHKSQVSQRPIHVINIMAVINVNQLIQSVRQHHNNMEVFDVMQKQRKRFRLHRNCTQTCLSSQMVIFVLFTLLKSNVCVITWYNIYFDECPREKCYVSEITYECTLTDKFMVLIQNLMISKKYHNFGTAPKFTRQKYYRNL